MRLCCWTLAALVAIVWAPSGYAQTSGSTRRTVIVTENAPIFLYPDSRRVPLQIAKEGSRISVLDTEGDWYRVEFRDPSVGLRVGYIEKKFVTLSVPEPASHTPADQSSSKPVTQSEVASSPAIVRQPREAPQTPGVSGP